MKIVIFAGGVGTRLWPLSRKNTPKQFEKIIGDKSTLQEAVGRLIPQISHKDIFIATGLRYENILKKQLPEIPEENFIFEPEMRDVGPAIGLVSTILKKKFPNEPVGILWSDHLVKNTESFKNALFMAEETIKSKKSNFVFIAQKARFANQNMGWIEVGEKKTEENGVSVFAFKKLYYRPSLSDAEEFFSNKNFVWNLGYFVTTPSYLNELFSKFAPEMHAKLKVLGDSYGTHDYEDKLKSVYPVLEKISFDDAVLVKLKDSTITVISSDLGWSDVGAWEALKEALSQSEDENITKGNVELVDSRDSLVFNYKEKLVVGIDLDQFLVINTEDVLLVCPKKSVPKIKKLVESLVGTPHEYLT